MNTYRGVMLEINDYAGVPFCYEDMNCHSSISSRFKIRNTNQTNNFLIVYDIV